MKGIRPSRNGSGTAFVDAGGGTVECGGSPVSYRIRRSRRRTLGITVHPDLSVVARAPMRVPLGTVHDFVRSRAAWIGNALRRFAERPPKAAPPAWLPGETHRFLGREYRLVVSRGRADAVDLVVGCLCVTTKSEPSPARVKSLLEGWYRERAEAVFAERLAACHRRMAGEGIPFPELRIRKMTSRWGSCSPAGRINLNLWLVRAPVACIDYVVVHELCHFKVRSHGPKFWNLVARHVPRHAELRKALNADGG